MYIHLLGGLENLSTYAMIITVFGFTAVSILAATHCYRVQEFISLGVLRTAKLHNVDARNIACHFCYAMTSLLCMIRISDQ